MCNIIEKQIKFTNDIIIQQIEITEKTITQAIKQFQQQRMNNIIKQLNQVVYKTINSSKNINNLHETLNKKYNNILYHSPEQIMDVADTLYNKLVKDAEITKRNDEWNAALGSDIIVSNNKFNKWTINQKKRYLEVKLLGKLQMLYKNKQSNTS